MAAIDHTCIVWKNGEYIPIPFKYDENDNLIDPLPFEYGRDGNIIKVQDPFRTPGTLIDISPDIHWHHRDDYWAIYERAGIRWKDTRWWTWYGFRAGLQWAFHKMHRLYYEYEVGEWKCGDTEVYIYRDEAKQYYVSFYKNGTDTYVVLGGYGHWENVYCHFMGRGYGDEFEKKMAVEAYQWACRDVLEKVADETHGRWNAKSEEWLLNMRSTFKYDSSFRYCFHEED